eukprot:SAG22_NODE_99_length_20560_cov_128.669029_4_plen_81_part_00
MRSMFSEATAFRGAGVGHWDVGQCKDFGSMFRYAEAFDQDLGGWKIHDGAKTNAMFYNAAAFERRHAPWATVEAYDHYTQ